MSTSILDLGNSANWQLFYSNSLAADTPLGTHKPVPIPEFTLPVQLDRHIIAIAITSSTAKPTWYFAGFLNQRIAIGLVVSGLPDSDVLQRRKLYLDRISVLIFPKLSTSYSLSLELPKWFTKANLTVWEYVGPESDSTENLIATLQNTVNAIKAKTDKL